MMFFRTTWHVVGHEALENAWQVVIKAYKFTVLESFFCYSSIIYCVSALSLHIESTNSIIIQKLGCFWMSLV